MIRICCLLVVCSIAFGNAVAADWEQTKAEIKKRSALIESRYTNFSGELSIDAKLFRNTDEQLQFSLEGTIDLSRCDDSYRVLLMSPVPQGSNWHLTEACCINSRYSFRLGKNRENDLWTLKDLDKPKDETRSEWFTYEPWRTNRNLWYPLSITSKLDVADLVFNESFSVVSFKQEPNGHLRLRFSLNEPRPSIFSGFQDGEIVFAPEFQYCPVEISQTTRFDENEPESVSEGLFRYEYEMIEGCPVRISTTIEHVSDKDHSVMRSTFSKTSFGQEAGNAKYFLPSYGIPEPADISTIRPTR